MNNENKNENESENNITFFSIDRFEDDIAVCENKTTKEFINIKRSLLPKDCKEGDILKFENGKFIIDTKKTTLEQNEIKSLVNNLFKKKD